MIVLIVTIAVDDGFYPPVRVIHELLDFLRGRGAVICSLSSRRQSSPYLIPIEDKDVQLAK